MLYSFSIYHIIIITIISQILVIIHENIVIVRYVIYIY